MTTKLRLGLLLDSFNLPAWAFSAIERISSLGSAEFALVILNRPARPVHSVLTNFWRQCNQLPYGLFNAIDSKLFLHEPNALTLIDASNLLSNTHILGVNPIEEKCGRSLSLRDIEEIRAHQLDILINLTFDNLVGEVLSEATYGVWTYKWGNHNQTKSHLVGLPEVAESRPETRVALQISGLCPDANLIACESWYFTYLFSPARSRNYILWSASSFLLRQIERLYYLGSETFCQNLRPEVGQDTKHTQKINDIPSGMITTQIAGKLIARNLKEISKRFFYREQWALLFDLGHNDKTTFSKFKRISPPIDRFWADPHVIHKAPSYFIFVEEFLFSSGKGHLSVIEMDQQGNFKWPVPVLQKDYHLSYPFVFEWIGKYYMIPETAENGTIDLYECTEFPYQWQLKKTLMKNIKAVDTTLFYDQGKWWLFTALAENTEAFPQVELFLFYADELFSDQWHPHPLNQIVSDLKNARPAGRIFKKDGQLFRPAQNCSDRYGFGFNLNQIATLSPTEYLEKQIYSVKPDWDRKVQATHTYWSDERLTVIDILTQNPRWI